MLSGTQSLDPRPSEVEAGKGLVFCQSEEEDRLEPYTHRQEVQDEVPDHCPPRTDAAST
jgi:hypothetical protein